MSATYSGSKPAAIYHLDDNGTLEQVLSCTDTRVGGAPSAAHPFCYDSFDAKNKVATSTGRGIENGNFGYG
jgi:hypothetical protein